MKVIIDPARGGNDTGVSGGGITEKDWNLAISKYIYNILKKVGTCSAQAQKNISQSIISSKALSRSVFTAG